MLNFDSLCCIVDPLTGKPVKKQIKIKIPATKIYREVGFNLGYWEITEAKVEIVKKQYTIAQVADRIKRDPLIVYLWAAKMGFTPLQHDFSKYKILFNSLSEIKYNQYEKLDREYRNRKLILQLNSTPDDRDFTIVPFISEKEEKYAISRLENIVYYEDIPHKEFLKIFNELSEKYWIIYRNDPKLSRLYDKAEKKFIDLTYSSKPKFETLRADKQDKASKYIEAQKQWSAWNRS